MSETKEEKKLDWIQMNFDIHKFFIVFSLFLCSLSLILISFRLAPLAKWANFQSICVEQISKTYPIEYAVRKCNGRSKIYMPTQQTQK